MAAPTVPLRTFKIVFAGEAASGKTALLKRHITGEFQVDYVPTVGVSVYRLGFETSKGPIVFNCWDTAGQEKLAGLVDGYYIGADAAMVFFAAVANPSDMRAKALVARAYAADVRRVAHGEIPIAYCANKSDTVGATAPQARLTPLQELSAGATSAAYEISAKSNLNFEKPFLWIARQLLADPALVFTEALPLLPPLARAELPLGEESDEESGEEGGDDYDSEGYSDEEEDVLEALEVLEATCKSAGLATTVALLTHRNAPGCERAAQKAADAVCEALGELSARALRNLASAVDARARAQAHARA